MSFVQGDLLYEGKAKKIYSLADNSELIWQEFKDSFTAFNGEKKAEMVGKGAINCEISTLIYKHLHKKGLETHWVETNAPNHQITKKLKMIDLEVVVRNILAGSTAKKLEIPEGETLEEPLVELFYKKDALNDPFINEDQAWMLKTVSKKEDLENIRSQALAVNSILQPLMSSMNIQLVDFKLEFGYLPNGKILLGDEISPDSCRLWEKGTNRKMDKDRFRRDLGGVLEAYTEVLQGLKGQIGDPL